MNKMASNVNDMIPRLGFEEMRSEMNKYGVDINQSTLKNPSTEDIQGVYSICIKYILNKDIQNIRIEEYTGDLKSSLPTVDGLQILPNEGKNHLQAIGNLRFIRHCEKINKILNLDNILSYIFKPVGSHMTKLINAFIHFMKFRDQLYNENDEKIKSIQEKKNESDVLETELKIIENELHKLLLKHEEIRNNIINEKNIKRNYEEEIIKNQNLLNSQQSLIISLNSTKDKIVNETNEIIFQYSRYRQKKEDLEDQIVPSSEKLQQHNDELKNLLYEHLSHYEDDKKKNDDMKNKINIADICIKKLVDLLTALNNHFEHTIKLHIEKKNILKTIDKQYKSLTDEKQNFITKNTQQNKIIQDTEECIQQEQTKWNQKIKQEQHNTILIQQKVKDIYQNVDDLNIKTNREINQINNIIKHIQDIINNYNKNFLLITELIQNTKNSHSVLTQKVLNNMQTGISTNM
ncbi:kinetochore protein NUF2, putative [Plasmodium sp. gorilla clade G3]|nr:kinetochore protein NUF2, putative [Plasmodium sp. gorilla clade G3]